MCINRKGMYDLYPPLRKDGISLFHLLDILFSILRISENCNNILYHKPPFIIIPYLSHTPPFKYGEVTLYFHFASGIIALFKYFTHTNVQCSCSKHINSVHFLPLISVVPKLGTTQALQTLCL